MRELLFRIFGEDRYLKLTRLYHQLIIYVHNIFHPYHFDVSRYEGTFLENGLPVEGDEHLKGKVDRVIYIFWTGDNEITPNRLEGIKSLEKVCGVDVKLITPQNLPEYIKEDDPLPEAYQYLSLNHRSDYLRSYFMHHYGGGYADIKIYNKSWVPAFQKLDNSDAYAIGYHEVGFWGAATSGITNHNLLHDLHYYWSLLIGNGAFICRPHTKLTQEWHEEAKRKIIENAALLKEHPAKDIFGTNEDYPLPWSGMQGSIFHPLCLKYHDKLLKDKALMPSFENYR